MSKKSVARRLKKAKKDLERSVANRYKSRGGLLPTITHGDIEKPRDNKIDVVETDNGKVDLDAYEDVE
jgi:hypothetical protein